MTALPLPNNQPPTNQPPAVPPMPASGFGSSSFAQPIPPASNPSSGIAPAPKEQSITEIDEELSPASQVSPAENALVGAPPGQDRAGLTGGELSSKKISSTEGQDSSLSIQESDHPKEASDEEAVKAKADKTNLPYVNLVGYAIAPETLQIILEEIAKKYQVIPYLKVSNKLKIAAIDPQNKETLAKISEIVSEKNLEPLYAFCSPASIAYALKSYQLNRPATEAGGDLQITGSTADFQKEMKGFIALRHEISKVPTTKMFDVIVSGAMKNQASDIHIEPTKEKMRLRYRVDGILQDVANLPFEAYKSLLSRIKFLAKMKLDLKNLPQDGRFTMEVKDQNIDVRVSTLPTVYGEGVVMRLLVQDKGFLTLTDLGFNKEVFQKVEEAIGRPTGMILNTGPTGSGKTTTLYAILDKINKAGVKIITLEDPVEYRIAGVTQSQIDSYSDYGFARGLRSILRQDPDIVMVGEIRDLETARIALNAAMTGHLVLSTLHTNNATAALSRLLDIGVKPFLVAGNINLVIAQRLVRQLCRQCRKKYHPRPGVLTAIKKTVPQAEIPEYLWQAVGCRECHGTGYTGRIPVAEAFVPISKIEKMVMESTPAAKIREAAIAEGMQTMEQDGMEKVISGLTTIQEVWRVTKE